VVYLVSMFCPGSLIITIMLFSLLSVGISTLLGRYRRPVLKGQKLVAGILQFRSNSSMAFAVQAFAAQDFEQTVL